MFLYILLLIYQSLIIDLTNYEIIIREIEYNPIGRSVAAIVEDEISPYSEEYTRRNLLLYSPNEDMLYNTVNKFTLTQKQGGKLVSHKEVFIVDQSYFRHSGYIENTGSHFYTPLYNLMYHAHHTPSYLSRPHTIYLLQDIANYNRFYGLVSPIEPIVTVVYELFMPLNHLQTCSDLDLHRLPGYEINPFLSATKIECILAKRETGPYYA